MICGDFTPYIKKAQTIFGVEKKTKKALFITF
nr:MAG TPA: hypothetical protein [Caudoviricetes sp.]